MPEYPYPRPALTVDLLLFRKGATGQMEILLVRRKGAPFQGRWALPGGFVNEGETARAAAVRETIEETHVAVDPKAMQEVGFFDAPGRDPRGWVVSMAFVCQAPALCQAVAGDDAAEVRWWPVVGLTRETGGLAFDHDAMISAAFRRLAIHPRNPHDEPEVGDGVTKGIGGDRYPYEVTQVTRGGREIVVSYCDPKTMRVLQGGEYRLTKRGNGRWVTKGQPKDDCYRWSIGTKDYHQDPSF